MRKRHKIIFFSPVGNFKGGAERSLFDLMSNPDVEVFLAAPEDAELLAYGRKLGLQCFVIPIGKVQNIHRPFSFLKAIGAVASMFEAATELKKLAKQLDCHIVHSNGLKAHFINCASKWIGGAHAVLHIRDIPITKSEIFVWHLLHFLSDAVIIVSKSCWPTKNLPKDVHVVHNGIESGATNDNNRHDFVHIPTLAFIGRVHPAKGLHLLIDWIAKAKEKGLNLRLDVRGAFSEDSPEYEQKIQAQVQKLNLEQNVKFSGYITNQALLYSDIDIVVVPSHVPDPLPRSVMEPMAIGIPVLGYPSGGIIDMIEDGVTGYLVHDGQTFYKAISELTTNPQKRISIIQNAQRKIQNDFTIEKLHKEVNDIYTQIESR